MSLPVYILAAVAAYLLGSLPTGYLVGRARGVDIRRVGSGNIGATNVFRALGTPAGLFVLVMDGLKGYAACGWVAPWLAQQWQLGTGHVQAVQLVAGVAAVLGHNYTCWLRFRGGKGIATSAGVMAALVPWALLIAAVVWGLVFVLSRYVSLSSVTAAVVLPIATWLTTRDSVLLGVTVALALLAVYRHRSNLQRLRAGTEPKLTLKKKPTEGAQG